MQNQNITGEYLRAGLALVPIPSGTKGPTAPGWNLRANCITDPADAHRLAGLNVGLAHRYSGTCSVDIDDEEQATPWLASHGIAIADLVTAPAAVRVSSGRKGRGRLTYRLPAGVEWLPTLKPHGSGLELRCATKDGASTVQDVLPPSIHPETGRPYIWCGDWRALPTLPDPVLALWRKLSTEPRQRADTGAAPVSHARDHEVIEGGRNDFLTSRAGAIRRAGFAADAIELALLATNAAKCSPPLPENEVRAIARSVAKYEAPPDIVVDAEATAARLALLSGFEYDQKRKEEAERLGIRVATLDNAVAAKRPKESSTGTAGGTSPLFPKDEPCTSPVAVSDLLGELYAVYQRHVICDEASRIGFVLWTAWTWVVDAGYCAPILGVLSPEPRCGKSTALSVLRRLVYRPLAASNLTPAVMFRAVDAWKPTLLIDEGDTFLRENEELRGIINSGHTRDTAFVLRTVGDDHEPAQFNTFAAKAIAMIGKPPATIMDRMVAVWLRRKLNTEKVPRLPPAAVFTAIRSRLARFAADNLGPLHTAEPELPECLNDRQADGWRPLLAIADLGGDVWSLGARHAAKMLSGAEQAVHESYGTQLLTDIRAAFEEQAADKIQTVGLVHHLVSDPERPWSTLKAGRPLDARRLATMLAPYGVTSKTLRIGTTTAKGYARDQFTDAWTRYTPSAAPSGGSGCVTA